MTPLRYTLIVLAVAAAGLTAAWAFAETMGMAFLESGYPIVLAKRHLVESCTAGQVVMVGDSRAESAMIPADMPVPAANLGLGSTGPVETYFTVRALLRCPHPPAIVLYAHSIEAYQTIGEGLWQRGARFGLIHFRDLRAIAAVAHRLHDPSLDAVNTNDGLTGLTRDLAYSFGFPSVFTSSALDARLFGRYDSNRRVLAEVTAGRGHVVYPDGDGRPHIGNDARIARFAPTPLEVHYVDATFRLLSRAGVTTIVIPIPIARATAAALHPGIAADTIAFLAAHTRDLPHVIDHFPAVVAWPDRFFVDGSHLNSAGAAAFSRRLGACVAAWRSDPAAPCDLTWRHGD